MGTILNNPSTRQQKIIDNNGLFVVRACPGSGKTFTVANRLITKIKNWSSRYQGIATISFTNVACDEIERNLDLQNIQVEYPHFLGTIDSFINKYIFLPFGHLIMNCSKRPKLIGLPINTFEPSKIDKYSWGDSSCYANNCKLNEISYDLNGNLYYLNKANEKKINNCSKTKCSKLKKRLYKDGLATQADANYCAMEVLKRYPQLSKILATRFPELMIDEAQDSSEIHMEIIDLLIDAGLKEVMLVGDPDQAIYEWRAANPSLFNNKYKLWESNSICLDDNYRSSQQICDFSYKISSLKTSSSSKTNFIHYSSQPEIIVYHDIAKIQTLIESFFNFCNQNNIPQTEKNIAVLVRSNNLLKFIQHKEKIDETKIWKSTNDIAKDCCNSKYLYENGDFKSSIEIIDKAIRHYIIKTNDITISELEEHISNYGLLNWRKGLIDIIKSLPTTQNTLLEWIRQANIIITTKTFFNKFKFSKFGIQKQSLNDNLSCEKIFKLEISKKQLYYIGTVHSAKANTFDAVLFILGSKTMNSGKYSRILTRHISKDEELRIIYVAITRPRKILWLAVPETDIQIWKNKFY